MSKRKKFKRIASDPARIFQEAVVFNETSNMISQAMFGKPAPFNQSELRFSVSYMVNKSFCIELYLKCLKQLEDKDGFLATHDHLVLFDDLSEECRDSLSLEFDIENKRVRSQPFLNPETGKPFVSLGLREALEKGGKTFEIMRYVFEEVGKSNEGSRLNGWCFSLGPLPRILNKYIIGGFESELGQFIRK